MLTGSIVFFLFSRRSKKIIVFAFTAIFLASSLVWAADSTDTSSSSIPTDNPYLPVKPKVEVLADTIEYDRNKNLVIAKGNVVVRDGDNHLTCDYAEVATGNKKVFATGHVVVFHKNKAISSGNEINYDFESGTGRYPEGRFITIPWIINGKEMDKVSEGKTVIQDGTITTCDLEKPHYQMKARKITVYEGDKMVARNLTLYVLDKPIFWLPFFVLPLQEKENLPLSVNVGYNSRHGYFIETSAGYSITKNVWGRWHLDFRSQRGVGGGTDIHYDFQEEKGGKRLLGEGVVKAYITQDKRAPVTTSDVEHGYQNLEDKTRGRLTWIHRADFDENTNIILRYNRLEDEYFLQDFFRNEARAEIEPQSFAAFTKNSERFGFLTHVEKQANKFESLVERLPQVQFDWKTQPFFNQHLFYENQTSFANLTKQIGRNASLGQDVMRYDNFHEWTLPLNWRNLKFTPFLDGRGTYFSREYASSDNHFRALFSTGIDMRTHFYKTYEVDSDKFGIEINQLRHVIEPVAQYKTVKSTVSDETLSDFDSVNRLDDADIVTLGVENRLQTKRMVQGRVQRVDVVSLNTYLSYELNPDGKPLGSQLYPPLQDGVTDSSFTVASQEIVLRPYEWLQAETRFDYGLGELNMRVFNQDFVIKKGPFSFVFGYRFIRDFIDFDGNEQYVFNTSYIINPLWTAGGYIRWHGGEVQEWQLIATRDMHDFILDMGLNVNNSDIQSNNSEVFVNFRLKAFPELGIKGGSRATFSEPRIGQTVAGANQDSAIPSYNSSGTTASDYYFR